MLKELSNVQKRVIDCGITMQSAIGAIELALVDTGDHHLPNSWLKESVQNQLVHAQKHILDFIDFNDINELNHAICRLSMARALTIFEKGGRLSQWEDAIHQVNGGRK